MVQLFFDIGHNDTSLWSDGKCTEAVQLFAIHPDCCSTYRSQYTRTSTAATAFPTVCDVAGAADLDEVEASI